ncbi:rRNA pseudouridine synthase [Bdellovibrio sp. SKB1291214]|uniref:pseudouridine synthase n=1 Tax=Bdellovibrio sp. SKB1291214 TaxID=1732569 RepID=UPI000B518C80|nr:pseudouridine synthase [Bdellovibrio sp. SKB1291214]UYL10008.1 rRNA pseudouridine synthase [Bdellovibrio sp. SKB1291214]
MSEDNTSQRVRLNKLIADSGLASRRHADKMIEEGLVTVNGKRVYELGVKVDPQHDKILVDGKVLRKPLSQKLYLIFNKPAGVLTTMDDPEGRPTIAEYLGDVPSRVFPVGRLDWDSEGMILLTNDGDYANKVAHPKEEVTKTYLVKLDGKPEPRHLQKLKDGVSIVGGKVSARHIEKIKKSGDNKSEKYEWYKIVITEGKNRQIRQMFAKIGFDVMRLQRVAIGRLRMGAMKAGELMFINDVAANRVFLADDPEDLKVKKNSYKGRATAMKKTAAEKEKAREKKMSAGKKKYAGGKLIAPKGPKRK